MPGPTRQVHAVDWWYPPRMSQSTRSRPDAEAGQSRSAAQRDGALAPGPPAGLVPKDHIPKRRRRGSGGVRVLAAVACLAWLAWPTEAVAQTYTITISAITFNDILDASEYSDGFNITGSTGTEQDITVDVTLGTKTWQTTSNTQNGGNWWWSVTVDPNANYISHGENQVTASAAFPNNVVGQHSRDFYAYLYAPPQINGDTQIQWAENTAENVEVRSYPVVYDDVSLLGFDVSGADEDDFSVLQSYPTPTSMSLSVAFEDSPDFEDPDDANTDNEYRFTLELTEGPSNLVLVSKHVTVTVTDEPAVSGSTAVQYAENGTGTVKTYTTSETVTWTLEGDDRSAFNISTGGALSFASPPDHENATDADTDNVDEVTVVATDGSEAGRLDVSVRVTGVDEAPTADAGADQTVDDGTEVTLDGSGSADVDGDTLTYLWAQTAPDSGADVTLSSTAAEQPTFTAPERETDVTLTFELKVSIAEIAPAGRAHASHPQTPSTLPADCKS